jgi:hypothetical protein
LEDVPACAKVASRIDPRRILETGISKAFFGKTDGIDGKSWEKARNRLKDMSLEEARGIWQTIANEVAVDCFDRDDNIDDDRLRTWMEFFGDVENFKQRPYRLIPHMELMRSQIHRVCECLVLNKNGANDLLNSAKNIIVGKYGQSFLATTSKGMASPLKPAVAILASQFTPHRQPDDLMTCSMDSIINMEIRNHPERLIKMYIQILSSDQFTFPSGYTVSLQPIVNGSITVDLKNGGKWRNVIFTNIMSGDPTKVAKQIKDWQKDGIGYVKSANPAERYKLKMSIHNMNDVLLAHLFQISVSGSNKVNANSDTDDIITIYAGLKEWDKIYSLRTKVDGPDFLNGIAELKKQAEAQWQLGHRYMRVAMLTILEKSPTGQTYYFAHVENVDINALLALDLNNMQPGKPYAFGDCNWYANRDMWQDIPRRAVRKVVGNPPTYEFGILRRSTFEKDEISMVFVSATDVKEHDSQFWKWLRSFAQFWKKFRP